MVHPVRQYRLLMFTNTGSLSKTKHNLTFRIIQKISSNLLFRSSSNTDRFYTFYISQGSVATQLRCCGMFSNYLTTNLSHAECASEQNLQIGQYLAKIWTKLCGLLFGGHPVFITLSHICLRYLLFVLTRNLYDSK